MRNRIKNHMAMFSGAVLALGLFGASAYLFSKIAEGATNISSNPSEHWAWNDLIGWVDFYNTQGGITVSSQKLTGYASSSIGDISLDCATTRRGDICSTSNYGVINNGGGLLSGYGWNDTFGWISFDCHNNNGCASSNYETRIDAVSGAFSDYAWNDLIGWISFNCSNTGNCGTSDYKVVTSWRAVAASGTLDSAILDSGVVQGAQLNSFMWHGSQPPQTLVQFRFAGSNSTSGPWLYLGPDGTENSTYDSGPDVSVPVNYSYYNNMRYYRYRVLLFSDLAQTVTPRVDDVILNWSP